MKTPPEHWESAWAVAPGPKYDALYDIIGRLKFLAPEGNKDDPLEMIESALRSLDDFNPATDLFVPSVSIPTSTIVACVLAHRFSRLWLALWDGSDYDIFLLQDGSLRERFSLQRVVRRQDGTK